MSLYFDAVSILDAAPDTGGSLKSRIYNAHRKSSPPQIYALITEVTKWNVILKDVIENSGILSQEPKLTPLLSLLLVHDLLLSKKGVAAPANHPLRAAIERHKTRLSAELTKVRVRRGCATIEQLRSSIAAAAAEGRLEDDIASNIRWVRINNARSTLKRELETTFKAYSSVTSLRELSVCKDKKYFLDKNIPDLIAIPPDSGLLTTSAYKEGRIILQDKASCFPAYLLLGDNAVEWQGDLIDGCAAPGNKTTHLASLLSRARQKKSIIYSLDASPTRSKTLIKMVGVAGVENRVTVLAGQDFLAIDPYDPRFKDVTGLLLDPSCSGSGIVKREDVPRLILPECPSKNHGSTKSENKSRKRKRKPGISISPVAEVTPQDNENETAGEEFDITRLIKLSNLQAQIVEHAFKFPSATKIAYSTCSIHAQENENVVSRVLKSDIAQRRAWRILPRTKQPEGLKIWPHRGHLSREHIPIEGEEPWDLSDMESEACLRCSAGDAEGTGGFFVAGFVRNQSDSSTSNDLESGDVSEEPWEGFDSEEE